MLGLPGSVFAFANSSVGSAYIQGLTGQPSTHWAKVAGEESAEAFAAFTDWLANEPKDAEPFLHTEAFCKAEQRIMLEMTKGVLESETSQLDTLGMHFGALPDALDARGEFYEACLNDPDIRAVGFGEDEDFPIPRNTFAERAIKPERPEEEETAPWTVLVEEIIVTSPNWDQQDQFLRQWKGKDAARRDCYFVITDEEFWHHAKFHDLKVDVYDRLKVQWAYQVVNHRIRNRRVLRVLEYNEMQLAVPLQDTAIRAILGDYDKELPKDAQQELFEDE